MTRLLPGLGLAAAVAAAATVLSVWVGNGLLGYEESPISAILLAVFLGLVVRNTVGPAPAFVSRFGPGLEACARPILRTGVALLGIRLSLASVAAIGVVAVPIVVGCIATALLLVIALGRWLRLPPRLAWLIAAGTSICGITAIVAVAPVIEADETETSYAVATIALFGMLALFTYPFLAHLLFDDPAHAGLFLGTSIHDTSQVVGAGLAYQSQYAAPMALETAVVTKLLRNLSMVAVIPLIGFLHGRGARGRGGPDGPDGADGSGEAGGVDGTGVPLFVLGFLAMAVLRTVGDLSDPALGFIPAAVWEAGVESIQAAAEIALLLAMAAVGLKTSLRTLRVLGLRPLAAGLAAAGVVGVVSVSLIRLLA